MKMKSKMSTKGGAMGGPRKFNKGDQVKKKKKSKFPDLNKDGKVTQADILQGRGVAPESGSSEAKKARLRYIPRKAEKKKPTKSMLMPGMTTAKIPASAMEKPTDQVFKKGGMKAKGMAGGGKMKAKGMKAGGKMKAKGMKAGGMKSKGYAVGGMKSKGYAVGGMKSKMATKKKTTKQKVRGAGIARKGVRPAKMR